MNKKAIAKELIRISNSLVSASNDNTAEMIDLVGKIASLQEQQKKVIEDAAAKNDAIAAEMTTSEKRIRTIKMDSFDAKKVVAEMEKLGVNWNEMESRAVDVIEAGYGKRLPEYTKITPKWAFVSRR
jgi:hypothetical protein